MESPDTNFPIDKRNCQGKDIKTRSLVTFKAIREPAYFLEWLLAVCKTRHSKAVRGRTDSRMADVESMGWLEHGIVH